MRLFLVAFVMCVMMVIAGLAVHGALCVVHGG